MTSLATRQIAVEFNQPLSLDTSSVTSMAFMFYFASKFNQPLSLDSSSVTSMAYMFGVRALGSMRLAPAPRPQPFRLPVHTSPCFMCRPCDSVGRGGVQPAAEL